MIDSSGSTKHFGDRLTSLVSAAGGATGLVVLVAGTFLPWLQSGQERRNSYRSDGALQRLLDPHGVEHVAMQVWPYVAIACAAVVVTFLLGLRRTACVLAVVPAVLGGVVAVAALRADGNSVAHVNAVGPSVVLTGGVLAVTAAAVLSISARTTPDVHAQTINAIGEQK